MTTKEIISVIAKERGISKTQTQMILKTLFSLISCSLQKGERISLPNFGVFYTTTTQERKIIHPRTRKVIQVPAKRKVVFKPAKGLMKMDGC